MMCHASRPCFTLDWLLRSVNTVLTGEAKFSYLDDKSALDIQDGLKRAIKHIETSLNLIAGRLGIDHDRVFFGRFAVPLMVRYLDLKQGAFERQGAGQAALLVCPGRHVGPVFRVHGDDH
jgi:hypothetical protein